jgi:tRNA (guanine37-N1)-methyltransferase
MKINILTLYPEMFPGTLGYSLAGKAISEGKVELNVVNIRDFATDNYKSVDDTPFGGGAGMVMKPEVLDAAITATYKTGPLYYLSPRGVVFNQSTAKSWATETDEMTFLCGRFEGIDERILEKWQIQEISIGDFVLSGGEPALITMLDAMIRLIPSVMGNAESGNEESFSDNLLEYPQYTKPQVWQGRSVPEVLLSGHHANIRQWRLEQSKTLTKTRRPDLWTKYLANQ